MNYYFHRLQQESLRPPSISPSDSISHLGSGQSGRSTPLSMSRSVHQPATRPPQYPEEILWSLDDCKTDPDVKMSSTNSSRPPMERAIRHDDGTMVTASEWAAIKASARMVKADLLSLPPSRDRRAKDRAKSKVYFRTYFRKEWDAAVARMESLQPLLALCASHWKAEHVLGNTLLVKMAVDSADDRSDSPVDPDGKSAKSPKKRSAKRRSQDKKRQRKDKELAGPASSEVGGAKSDHMEISKSLTGDLHFSCC
jgi:hypothetical protein